MTRLARTSPRAGGRRPASLLPALALLALLASAGDAAPAARRGAAPTRRITVFAAASLAEPFDELAALFQR